MKYDLNSKKSLLVRKWMRKGHVLAVAIGMLWAMHGCMLQPQKMTTERLEREVQSSMEEKFRSEGLRIKIIDFSLIHEVGNVYSGLLEANEPFGDFTYTVKVVYDGEQIQWEINNRIR